MDGQNDEMHGVIALAPLPSGTGTQSGSTVQINAHMVAYVDMQFGNPTVMLTYNIKADRWSKKQPMITGNSAHNSEYIAFDKSTSSFYWASLPGLKKIDPKGLEISSFDTNLHFKNKGCTMLSIEGNIHFISGASDKHLVWSTRTCSILTGPSPIGLRKIGICIPDEHEDYMSRSNYRAGGTAVYIPGEHAILLIGGMTDDTGMCGTPTYDHVVWKGLRRSPDSNQWEWQQLKEHGPGIPYINAVVTADSQYVIISAIDEGGYYYSEEWFQYIYVIDVRDNYQWRRTEIKIPLSKKEAFSNEYYGKTFMFRSGDAREIDIVVSGFIRKEYRTEEFTNVLQVPVELINMIQLFFADELIHWFSDKGHAAIRLRDILSAPSHDAIKACGSCFRCACLRNTTCIRHCPDHSVQALPR